MGEERTGGDEASLYFRRLADRSDGCFQAQSGTGLATRPHPRVLYVDSAPIGETIALAGAWSGGGVLVFLPPGPVDRAEAVAQTRAAVETRPDWKLIWFDEDWRADGLAVRLGPLPDPGPEPVAESNRPARPGTVASGGEIHGADNLVLRIAAGSGMELDRDRNLLRIGVEAGEAPSGLPRSVLSLLDREVEVAGEIEIDVAGGGILGFGITMPDGLDATIDLLTDGHRLRFPLFPIPATGAVVTLDPGAVESSRIALGEHQGVVTTGYRSTTGRPIELRMEDGWLSPRLVGGPPSQLVALTPGGRFAGVAQDQMVAGLNGSETITLDQSTEIRFHPDMPGSIERGTLTSSSTTAWVSVGSEAEDGVGVGFQAQPIHEGYHRRSGGDFWERIDVRAASLHHDDIFPMIPYGRFTGDPGMAATLEQDVIRPVRGRALSAAGQAMETRTDGAVTRGVTPNGFEAELVDGVIRSIIVAQVGETSLAIDTSTDAELRRALSSDGRFIVMSRPPPFATLDGTSAERLDIDGWKFNLRDGWNDRTTMLLFKQDGTRSLADLVADPASWHLADRFNRRPGAVADRLRAYVAEAAESTDPVESSLFDRVLNEPNWRGVLVIGCGVPLGALPPELAALKAGIDANRFAAHHLGIDQRPVLVDEPVNQPADADADADADDTDENEVTEVTGPAVDSSVFGLIAYRGRGGAERPGRFSFEVESLRVEIAETRLNTVNAAIRIGLGSFLGSAIDRATSLRLRGQEQRRDGVPHYSFVSADRGSDRDGATSLRDAVLASVAVAEAQLTTTIDPDGTVEARFGLSGAMAFHPPPDDGPDLIGYRLVDFRAIDLVMSFAEDKPSQPAFHWNTAAATISAQPTAGSLPSEFPITPRSMLSETTRSPAALGFQTIRLPIEVTAPSGAWHGLAGTLDLGTMGEMASTAAFRADFGLFWSPHPTERRLAFGLRFPGADVGAYGFTIQDVIKLAAHGIVLHDLGPKSTDRDHGRFLLKLEGLGLEIMGFAIPWSGSFDLSLNPGPDPAAGLGWYGAYTPEPTST